MAINEYYNEEAVITAISTALEVFYNSLIDKIDGLDIVKVMKRKNPYLYRAKAMENAAVIVESVLNCFLYSQFIHFAFNFDFSRLQSAILVLISYI